MPGLPDLLEEANRQLTICNACRYCEGYCAVFPAIERRAALRLGDLAFLASLCHDCRACYQACMYTPPHPFAVNVPALMTEARGASYRHYIWPGLFASLLNRPGWTAAAASLLAGAVAVGAVAVTTGPGALVTAQTGPGAFYRVIGWGMMAASALVVSGAALALLAGGFYRFWREIGGSGRELLDLQLWSGAARDALSLRYMRGGGGECHYPDLERPSPARRVHHQTLVAGFLLCFAATVAAAIEQDILGVLPPYPVLSAPVLLGIVGGLGLLGGAGGLLAMKRRSAAADLTGPSARLLDTAFLLLVEAVAVTGMLLFVLRGTAVMGALLVVHLGAVGGLFLTAPYGKFIHAVHRLATLVHHHWETRAT